MVTFAKYFPLKDFINYFQKSLSTLSTTEKVRLGNLVKDYFNDLADREILTVPEDNFLNHENKFLGAVKRLVLQQPENADDNDAFAEFLMFQIAGAYIFPGTLDEQYNNFINCINDGEFFDIDFPRNDVCVKCGSTLALEATNWSFRVYAYKESLGENNKLVLDHLSVRICPENK